MMSLTYIEETIWISSLFLQKYINYYSDTSLLYVIWLYIKFFLKILNYLKKKTTSRLNVDDKIFEIILKKWKTMTKDNTFILRKFKSP